MSYVQIDDFLEGRPVDPEVHDALVARFEQTAHKRATPVVPTAPAH